MADITTQTIRDTFLDNLPENVTREEGEEFWNAWLDRQREGHEPDMPTPPVGFQYAPKWTNSTTANRTWKTSS